jgi:hypothetical protein
LITAPNSAIIDATVQLPSAKEGIFINTRSVFAQSELLGRVLSPAIALRAFVSASVYWANWYSVESNFPVAQQLRRICQRLVSSSKSLAWEDPIP